MTALHCIRCANELSAYLDGELPAAERARVEAHVEACAPCAAELAELSRSAALVESGTRMLEVDPALWHNLRVRVASLPRQPERPAWLEFLAGRRWLAAPAAVAAVAVIAFSVWLYQDRTGAERDLARYMNDYIKARETTGEIPGFTLASGNPFVQVSETSFSNPFRSEVR